MLNMSITDIDNEESIKFVRSRYPDAQIKYLAKLAIHVWCPLLQESLSMYFHTETEAWDDAVKRIIRNESNGKY